MTLLLLLLACTANKPADTDDTSTWGTTDTRTDDTATDTPTWTPVGPFTWTAVSMGGSHACGILEDGHVVCWGFDTSGETVAPTNRLFTNVWAGFTYSCGWTVEGALDCWGDPSALGRIREEVGSPVSLDIDWDAACAVYADGGLECWGDTGPAPVSTGVSAVAVGSNGCLSQDDPNAWTCWGPEWSRVNDVVPPRVTAVDVGWGHACGLDPDNGDGLCWGYSIGSDYRTPGPWASVVAGELDSCFLDAPGVAACHSGADVPDGPFLDLALGRDSACGVYTDGTLECWGGETAVYCGILDYPR